MTTDRGHGPAVGAPIPPPALLFAAVLAGFALRHFAALEIPISSAAAMAAGAVLLAAGVALGVAATRTLVRGGTTPVPHRPTSVLVSSGIFRITRNPIYLSMAVLILGIAVLARSGWHLVMLALFVLVIDRTQIRREERYLAGRFGDAYREYARRVRRWV